MNEERDVRSAMEAINRAWVKGDPRDMAPHLHPDVVMAFPLFDGRAGGAQRLIEGFEAFVESTDLLSFEQGPIDVDVIGDTAVATFEYEMKYTRKGRRYKATGRDLWYFGRHDGRWRATWRAMLDVEEERL